MKNFKLFLTLIIFLATALGVNKVVSDNKKEELRKQREKINYKIDNMGYWVSLAKKGIITFNPDVKPEPAVFKGTKIKSRHVRFEDSPDVPVASNSQQSENSIIVDPNDATTALNSNNSTSYNGYGVYGADYLYTFDIGESWEGSIQGPNGNNWGDPAVCIDNLGRWYVGYISSSGGQKISYSDNHGNTWTQRLVANKPSGYNTMCDKNHLWVDTKPGSPYENYVYDAWTDFGGTYNYQIVFKRSTDRGQTWGPRTAISQGVNAGSHNQGVNLATGPNGEVYAAWAVYDNGLTEKAIGFCKSTNGGASFSTAVRAFNNIYGIRNIGVPQNMRVNSFPVMAVDCSDGPYSGNIYIVWANKGVPGVNTGSDVDIYMLRSTDGGDTWDTPIRVNQDSPNLGKKHYLPWIAVDPVTGIISVIFYDNRNTSASNKAEAWVAVSTNGGETWEDFRVSDVEFKPQPIPGLADGYFGDYLGISAYNGKVYPVWTDNRTGKAMAYVSPFSTMIINDPYNFTADVNQDNGEVSLSWEHEQTEGFLHYNIYKDDVLIGSTTDKNYSDVLDNYTYVKYSVTAAYEGNNESMPQDVYTQYGTSVTTFTPDTVIAAVYVNSTDTVSAGVDIYNTGTLYSVYSYSPLKNNSFQLPAYEKAWGGGQEYINRVKISNLDNLSGYDGYSDYGKMNINVEKGKKYKLTVRVGNPFHGDKCAAWVDFDNNGKFDENPVILTPDEYDEIYTGTINIPENNLSQYFKMRIRLVGADDVLQPAGNSEYGETEDYLFLSNGWLAFHPASDTVQVNDTVTMTITFNGEGLATGVYEKELKFTTTDLENPMKSVYVAMALSDVQVQATASDDTVCAGSDVQLNAEATGGISNITYEWFTTSGVQISNEQNPVVTVDSTTSFVVAAHDTLTAVSYDTVTVFALPVPEVDLGPDTAFCGQVDTASIVLDAGNEGATYLWSTGATTQKLVVTKDLFGDFGTYDIFVTVTNENGCSSTDTVKVNIKDCTSIDELADNLKFNIFPNPSDGNFAVILNSVSGETVNIKLINVTGSVIYKKNNIEVNGKETVKINMKNASSGVYTLIIENQDSFISRKIVISK